jgi:hypothetical protein
MDFTPFKIIARCAAVAALLTPALFHTTEGAEWRSMTSFSDARRMSVIDDTLFVATSGGLLAVSDPQNPGRQYTNLSGLETADITDVIEAADGVTWVAGNGRLIKWEAGAVVAYPVSDNDGKPFRLLRLVDDGNFLWIGSSAGLILFSKTIDGGQIQDAFQLFDDLNPAPMVFDIVLSADSIWLATSSGLAVADRSSHVALKSPANWKGYRYDNHPELGSDTVRTVAAFDGGIYVGTSHGLFHLESTDDFTQMLFAADLPVYQLTAIGDSLFVFSFAGLGAVVGGSVAGISTPGISGGVTCGATIGGRRWLGRSDGGLFVSSGNAFDEYPFEGMSDNDVVDVAVAPDGTTAVLYRFDGPYEQVSDEWVHWPVDVASRGLAMKADQDSRFYVGSFGGGMSRVSDTVAQYKTQNSTLQEAGGIGSNYVVCYDVALNANYFFGVNFEPRDGTRLVIADLNNMDALSGWMALGVADGITGSQMISIDEYNGAVAIGSGLAGAYYYYYGSDPFNQSDDSLRHYTQNAANFRYRIISDVVRVVRFSPVGELWVGTNYGISRFDLGLEAFVEVALPSGFGPDITALEFDSRGNVWIGAKNGLARIDNLTGEVSLYTVENSGLLSDFVNNLTFDGTTGNLYVATSSGLSVMLSTFGPPTYDVAEAYAFPNPFVVESPDDRLNFNFSGNARLRVFTVAGELVVDLPEPVWDGRNAAGETVASGVYLYVLTDDLGNNGRGKFLLVRR